MRKEIFTMPATLFTLASYIKSHKIITLKSGILFAFPVFIICLFVSCEPDKCEICDEAPVVDTQVFEVHENASTGSIVDTVITSNAKVANQIFEIIGGNDNDVFRINQNSGVLYVNNASFLDFEKKPIYKLVISVSNSYDHSLLGVGVIIVNVLDVEPTDDSLVSFYTFQNNLNDVAGLNHATGNTINFFMPVSNDSNWVVYFNGVNSFVKIEDPFDYESVTLSVWFNALSTKDVLGVIYSSDNPTLKYGMHTISVKNDNGNDNIYFNTSGQISTVKIDTNKWYNAVISRANNKYKYYLNGELIVSDQFSYYLSSSIGGTSIALLGCLRTMDMRFFNGLIDNFRVYDRMLTDEEIKLIYTEDNR